MLFFQLGLHTRSCYNPSFCSMSFNISLYLNFPLPFVRFCYNDFIHFYKTCKVQSTYTALYFYCCHNEKLYLLAEVTFFAFDKFMEIFFTCKYLQSKNWYLCTDLPCEVLWHFEVLWSFYLVCHTPGCLNILGHVDRLLKLASRAVCGVEFIILGSVVVFRTKDWKLITGICKFYNKI